MARYSTGLSNFLALRMTSTSCSLDNKKACEAYTSLKREAARIGLRINATKTKYLVATDSDHLGSSVLVDGDNLEVVKESCYLGTIVTSDNDIMNHELAELCILTVANAGRIRWLGHVRRMSTDPMCLKSLYCCWVRPILENANKY